MLKLLEDGHTVEQAASDADTLIVEAALRLASSGQSVTVFANDTDVIVMLLHHCSFDIGQIIVRSDIIKKGQRIRKQLDIQKAAELITPEVTKLLPFIHAFGGCDTTSGIYDKGKQAVLKLIQRSEDAQSRARLFSD